MVKKNIFGKIKQKAHIIFALCSIVLSSGIAFGQDTLLGRKGFSVEAGFTIAYPILFSQYQYGTTYSPVSAGGMLFSASYNYSFINHRHSILGIRFKGGYFQNHYLYQAEQQGGNANANEYEYKSYLGAGIGLYMIKRLNKIGFYNEVNIFGKSQFADQFSASNQQPKSLDLACEGANNIYLNFESGIAFYISKKISLMPFLEYPVFEVSNIALWFPSLVTKYTNSTSDIYYSSFAAGVNLTYYW